MAINKNFRAKNGITLDSYGNSSTPSFNFLGNEGTGVWSPGLNQFAISTDSLQRFTINSLGYTGIATSSPEYTLDVSGDLRVTGSIINPSNDLYELDSFSSNFDGIENTFSTFYNFQPVSIQSPYNLLISVNGVVQSAHIHNSEYVFLTSCLASRNGYTIDYDGNIKFTESIPLSADVVIRTIAGNGRTTFKSYPFSALDIML